MNMNKDFLSITPISRNEMGQLRGGFSAYIAEPTEPIKTSVSVTVYGNCGCECEATGEENQ